MIILLYSLCLQLNSHSIATLLLCWHRYVALQSPFTKAKGSFSPTINAALYQQLEKFFSFPHFPFPAFSRILSILTVPSFGYRVLYKDNDYLLANVQETQESTHTQKPRVTVDHTSKKIRKNKSDLEIKFLTRIICRTSTGLSTMECSVKDENIELMVSI